jgi:hypothetical protein
MFKTITWNTGSAATRFRKHYLKKIKEKKKKIKRSRKLQATSSKHQAA